MTTDTAEMFADEWLAGEPVYLTDMGRCEPAEAASGWAVFKKWRKLEYEAEGHSGVMLLAGPEQAAPEISYDLGASGWHSISIGVYTQDGAPYRPARPHGRRGDFLQTELPGGRPSPRRGDRRAVLEDRRRDGPEAGAGPDRREGGRGRRAGRAPVRERQHRLREADTSLRRRGPRLSRGPAANGHTSAVRA